MSIAFASIHLIAQRGNEPWTVARTFSLLR
jgi:hypothetical protein